MEILSPIDSLEECNLLIKCGAKELFCGYVNETWINKFGLIKSCSSCDNCDLIISISPNKRGSIKANITSKEELLQISSFIRSNGAKLFITLNAFYYTPDLYTIIDKLLDDICEAKVYGVIVTDIALVKHISQNYPELYIALSCCAQASNINSIDFFVNLGVDRITFPRHISVDNMIEIAMQRPNTDFESFVLDGRCIYDDGNCKPLHIFGNFCHEQWDYDYYLDGVKSALEYDTMKELYIAEEYFKHWTKCLSAWDASTKGGWQSISCGACSVPALLKCHNVKALKIAGRGMNTTTKLHLIRLVKKMINIAQKDASIVNEIALIKETFGLPEYCDNHIRCLMR